jgi:uncharacterized repeat protein (TIGR02543 family)
VVASGNDGWKDGLPSPACASAAVSVGAVSDSNWGPCWGDTTATDKVACYSNTSNSLSLLAPGSAITSSVPGKRFETWHGTSMAAPHVAGAFGVLRQKVPEATVDQLLEALQTSGMRVTDSRIPAITTPRIDVDAALGQFATITYTRTSGLGVVGIGLAGQDATQCYARCAITFPVGSTVTVSAHPADGSTLTGWTGACTGSSPSCNFAINASTTLTADFSGPTASLDYASTGAGSGTVNIVTTVDRATCSGSCSVTVAPSTLVTATAVPSAGSRFDGWYGPCTSGEVCSFQMPNESQPLTARFVPLAALTFTKAGRGTGSVAFSPPGGQTSCASSCAQVYDLGTVVTLTAQPGPRARFTGWSGACRRKKACVVTMSRAQSVTATFSGR